MKVATMLLDVVPDLLLMMMVGKATPKAESTQILAAFGLSSALQSLVIGGFVAGLSSAMDTLCAQAFGGKRMTEFWLFFQAGVLMYAICLPLVMALTAGGSTILKATGQDPDIADLAAPLFWISLPIVPFCTLYFVLKSALQTQNIVTPLVTSSFAGAIATCIIGYLLTFHTPLGYLGVAVAGTMSWVIKTLMLVAAVLRNEGFQQDWPGWKPQEAMVLLPKVSTLGAFSVVMVTVQILGSQLISFLAGLLPNAQVMLSVTSIFGSLITLESLPITAVATAGSIRIGNALGAGDARRAALLGRMTIVYPLLLSLVMGLGIVIAVQPYVQIFTSDPKVLRVTKALAHEMLLLVPLMALSSSLQAIMRACGKQLVAAKLNFVSACIAGAALSWVFAITLHGGLTGLWVGNMAGMVVFALAGFAWLHLLSWEDLAQQATRNTDLSFAKKTAHADAF
uniref:Polysaccharide biosynthesis protein C-terminal domain-containing protein n=1 Tax=Globisporangium ultimum (strain ATCC 200006 / CBS 805.95 / DAOM BR144) TaxID=431595 RepID=K3X278_GLOUD